MGCKCRAVFKLCSNPSRILITRRPPKTSRNDSLRSNTSDEDCYMTSTGTTSMTNSELSIKRYWELAKHSEMYFADVINHLIMIWSAYCLKTLPASADLLTAVLVSSWGSSCFCAENQITWRQFEQIVKAGEMTIPKKTRSHRIGQNPASSWLKYPYTELTK